MTTDLEIAKRRLAANSLSFSIVREGKILFESRSKGLKDLFETVRRLGTLLRNASIADQFVGRAAAFLLVYAHFSSVFAATISGKGLELLERNHISAEFRNIIPSILNRERTDVCPFEEIVMDCKDSNEAFHILEDAFRDKVI